MTFKTATWKCDACDLMTSQRFHVPTDGDPASAPPPAGWTVDGISQHFYCPACTNAADAVDIEEGRTYTHVSDEEADAIWADHHICLRCLHMPVCMHAPDELGSQLLVTVSACRAWRAAEESTEDEQN